MIARYIYALLAILAFQMVPSLAWAQDAQIATAQNEFLKIVVNRGPNEAGRFSIETTGGDPKLATSKNQQIIYGGNTPWTSFTTVRVDDTNYVFGGKTERRAGLNANYGELVSAPTANSDSISTACKYGDDIVVTQDLGFVRGSVSRMFDTAGIAYRITNQGKVPHQVGLRILLDTKLGPNDGAPIRLGEEKISSAVAIPAESLSNSCNSWFAFDVFPPNSTIVSQGSLFGNNTNATKPDKVIFADWGTLADDVWEPSLDPRLGFHRKGEWDPDQDIDDADAELDTASALYWMPITLEPGKSVTYVTYYGIGYLDGVIGKLSLAATAPAETTFEYERTQPITIAGFLQNAGDFEARNVKFTIKLPAGLTLVDGSKATETCELLKPGDDMQASWVVKPNGKASGNLDVKIEATSDNVESNSMVKTIQVNVPKPRLVLTPNAQTLPPKSNRMPSKALVRINLTPSVDFYGANLVLTYDDSVLKPLIVSRGDELVDDEGRFLGWEYDTSEKGKIIISVSREGAPTLTRAEINLAKITFRILGEGKSALTLESATLIDQDGKENPVATSAGMVEVKADPIP